jgi:hypothetical protein
VTPVIDPVLAAQACRDIEQQLMQVPTDVLLQAKRHIEIQAHNEQVEADRINRQRERHQRAMTGTMLVSLVGKR